MFFLVILSTIPITEYIPDVNKILMCIQQLNESGSLATEVGLLPQSKYPSSCAPLTVCPTQGADKLLCAGGYCVGILYGDIPQIKVLDLWKLIWTAADLY